MRTHFVKVSLRKFAKKRTKKRLKSHLKKKIMPKLTNHCVDCGVQWKKRERKIWFAEQKKNRCVLFFIVESLSCISHSKNEWQMNFVVVVFLIKNSFRMKSNATPQHIVLVHIFFQPFGPYMRRIYTIELPLQFIWMLSWMSIVSRKYYASIVAVKTVSTQISSE